MRQLEVDKLTTVSKEKPGDPIGRLDDEDMFQLNGAILVIHGLA